MDVLDVTNRLIVDFHAREWCKLVYPLHPKGCPNYGKKSTCPPKAPLITEWLGDSNKWYFICVRFDLKNQIETMLEKHPDWTLRQARCLLYWQSKVNKELALGTYQFASHRGWALNGITYCPEAMGVNVIETARQQGLPIETKPQNAVYKISLVTNRLDIELRRSIR